MQTLPRSIGLHSSHTRSNSNQGRISKADHVSPTSSSIVSSTSSSIAYDTFFTIYVGNYIRFGNHSNSPEENNGSTLVAF